MNCFSVCTSSYIRQSHYIYSGCREIRAFMSVCEWRTSMQVRITVDHYGNEDKCMYVYAQVAVRTSTLNRETTWSLQGFMWIAGWCTCRHCWQNLTSIYSVRRSNHQLVTCSTCYTHIRWWSGDHSREPLQACRQHGVCTCSLRESVYSDIYSYMYPYMYIRIILVSRLPGFIRRPRDVGRMKLGSLGTRLQMDLHTINFLLWA